MTVPDITQNKAYQILEKAEKGGYGIAAVTWYAFAQVRVSTVSTDEV